MPSSFVQTDCLYTVLKIKTTITTTHGPVVCWHIWALRYLNTIYSSVFALFLWIACWYFGLIYMTHQLYKLSRLSNSSDKIVFKCLFEENIQPALFGRIQAMYGNCGFTGFPGALAGLTEFELCLIKPHKFAISYNLDEQWYIHSNLCIGRWNHLDLRSNAPVPPYSHIIR